MKTLIAAAALLGLAVGTAIAGDPVVIKVRQFGFVTPIGWTILPAQPEEDAPRLSIGRGQAAAEVTFSKYGMGGGSAKEDVDTWFAQFSGVGVRRDLETERIGPVKVVYARTEGTFSTGALGESAKRSGYALCGAVLESKNGSVYVRMVGPAATVRGATEAFKKMVSDAARSATTKPQNNRRTK